MTSSTTQGARACIAHRAGSGDPDLQGDWVEPLDACPQRASAGAFGWEEGLCRCDEGKDLNRGGPNSNG